MLVSNGLAAMIGSNVWISGGGSLLAGANENTSGAVAALNRRSLWAIRVLSRSGAVLGIARTGNGSDRTSATRGGVLFGTDSGVSRRAITAEGDCRTSTSLAGKCLIVSRGPSVFSVTSMVLRATILPSCRSAAFGTPPDGPCKSPWSVRGIFVVPTAE